LIGRVVLDEMWILTLSLRVVYSRRGLESIEGIASSLQVNTCYIFVVVFCFPLLLKELLSDSSCNLCADFLCQM
jgi:hypothetical protein